MRDKERFYPNTQSLLNHGAVERLIRDCHSGAQVESLLRKEGLSFSPDSIRNIFYALNIFREIRVDSPFSFFIYGSTAIGEAGLKPKIQEFQFWKEEEFLGSAFRFYGNSDLDIRCLAEHPEIIMENLQGNRLAITDFPPGSVKVDSFNFALQDIKNQKCPSFYRRILILNKPIIFSGREMIETLVRSGRDYLSSQDLDYEEQMRRSRSFARRELENRTSIFFSGLQLTEMFPVYYHPFILRDKEIRRASPLKFPFGRKESSLVTVQVGGADEVDLFIRLLSTRSSASSGDIASFFTSISVQS